MSHTAKKITQLLVSLPATFLHLNHKVWIKKQIFRPECLDNETGLREIYRKHNEEVKQSIPASQPLTYNLREGWGPLCDFLKHEKFLI